MHQVLNSLSTDELTLAIEEDQREFWRIWGHAQESELYEGTDLLRLYTGVPFAYCNGVICGQLPADRMDAVIHETVSYYRERNAKWEWMVGPKSSPGNLESRLTEHGLSIDGQNWGMAINLREETRDIQSVDGFKVVPVDSDTTLRTWANTLIEGFEAPAMAPSLVDLECSLGYHLESYRRYLGLLNDQPVAASALRVGKKVVGIYCVCTLPSARGMGIGGKITHHALREAQALGHDYAVLQSSQMGRSVYLRLGFQELSVLRCYRPSD